MGETRREMAERHVVVGRDIVERQERLVTEKKARGRDTAYEEALLATFKHSLALMESDWESMLKRLTR